MLVLLALLFASPYINRLTPKGAGKKLVVVAVDRSFSMRTKEGTSTRLDEAKAEALNVLSKLPPGQPAQVVALADTLQAMTQQTTDPGELRGAVSAIKESDARASFGELARYLRTLSESTKTPLDVHLISDLQKSAHAARVSRMCAWIRIPTSRFIRSARCSPTGRSKPSSRRSTCTTPSGSASAPR